MRKRVETVVPEDVKKDVFTDIFRGKNGIKIPKKELKTIYKPRLI
jgi:hypothetical protein